MLERILKIVFKGGSYSLQDIARELDTSKELLLQMVEDLERGGYLKLIEGKYFTECKNCSFSNNCSKGCLITSYNTSYGKIWILTKKGIKLAERTKLI